MLRPLMPGKDEGLYRQQQSLDPQQHRVHEPDRINGMQTKTLSPTKFTRRNQLVIAGVGVNQATTPRRYSFKTVLIERFEEHGDCARFCRIRYVDQLSASQTVRLTVPSNKDRDLLPVVLGFLRALFTRHVAVQAVEVTAGGLFSVSASDLYLHSRSLIAAATG